MLNFVPLLFSTVWSMFSIPWPGFQFTFGQVFLAMMVSGGALSALMRMTGVNVSGSIRSITSLGGNNGNIKISESRRGDIK